MTTTDGVSEIEFVNDWSELEEAVQLVHDTFHSCWYEWQLTSPPPDAYYLDINSADEAEVWEAVKVIKDYVPRLLTQYAKLVELSFALTEGWETYATLNAPTGLYLPDHG